MRYSIPTMGVVAVGKQMERTDRFFKLATRIVAEMGANIIKTYYCENFEEVVAACPVPIVVAGGKKLPEKEALTLAYNAISGGAHGVDMGRNIFRVFTRWRWRQQSERLCMKDLRIKKHTNSLRMQSTRMYLERADGAFYLWL